MTINIESSFYAWKMLKKLYLLCNDRKDYTFRSFSMILEVSRYDPVFNDIIHFLIEQKIITKIGNKDKTLILRIDTEKLVPLIEDSIWYEEVADYIRKTRSIYANI